MKQVDCINLGDPGSRDRYYAQALYAWHKCIQMPNLLARG